MKRKIDGRNIYVSKLKKTIARWKRIDISNITKKNTYKQTMQSTISQGKNGITINSVKTKINSYIANG